MHAEGRLRNLPGWHIRHPIGRIKNGSDQLQAPCLQHKGHVAARKGMIMAGVLFPNLCKPPQLQRWYREGGNTCPQAMSLTHGTLDTHQSRTIKKSTFLVKRLQCKYGTLHNRRQDLVPCVLVCLGVTAMSS